MKINILIISLLILFGCQTKNNSKSVSKNKAYPFFVGTYTTGKSQGIYKYLIQENGNLKRIGLAAKTENPSYLAFSSDRKYLLAVSEVNIENQGSIESYLVSEDNLSFISKSKSGGANPCFVSANKEGFVLSANYTGGNVGLFKINKKGKLSSLLYLQQHTGKGTSDRQQAPHAHSAYFSPFDSTVISVDLGSNQLWFSHLDTLNKKLLPNNPFTLNMQAGAGPRHLVFHPNGEWIYVINELDCTITLVLKKNGKYTTSNIVSTLPKDYSEKNTCAEIQISSDGKHVYASNRGHNSIAIYSVNKQNGSLELLGFESTRGNGPRFFTLSPDEHYLLVANQYTNNIVSFKRDKNTGLLSYIGQIDAPTPVCLLF